MLDLVRKCHKKKFILLNINNISKKDPDPDPVGFWGYPDPDPDFKNRIRVPGSEKMDRIRNTGNR